MSGTMKIISLLLIIPLLSGCFTFAAYRGDFKVTSFIIEAPVLVFETAIVDYAVLNNLELIAESQRLGLYRLRKRFPGAATWRTATNKMSPFTEPLGPTGVNPYGKNPFVTISLRIKARDKTKTKVDLTTRFETWGEPQGVGGAGPFPMNSKSVWEVAFMKELISYIDGYRSQKKKIKSTPKIKPSA